MAEIKVEKKKPIWPWILLIILILGILFYVFIYDDANDDVDNIDSTDDIEELNDTSAINFKETGGISFFPNKKLIS